MRKLATIRQITDVQPIENADAIEVASVDGWRVVIKKDEYQLGDHAIYLEIDSWVPHELAPFLSKGREPREYNGVKGERLRTVKLRGQVSQGLLLPLSILVDRVDGYDPGGYVRIGEHSIRLWEAGTDVTEILGVQKWEAPVPAQLQGQVCGAFPTSLIPKTDQERAQNCYDEMLEVSGDWEVTMKLDGSSCTMFCWEGQVRVCSRNMELKVNEENSENTFVKMAQQFSDVLPEGFAFQGEIMGPGVQGNREGLKTHEFFVFDVFDIKNHKYVDPETRRAMAAAAGMKHAPIIEREAKLPETVDQALGLAEGPSINHKIREGLVWKNNQNPWISFKTISNTFLLKNND